MLVPRDKSVRIERQLEELVVSWKGQVAQGVALALLGLMLGGPVIAIGYSTQYRYPAGASEMTGTLVFGCILLMACCYPAVAFLVNRTVLTANPCGVSVRHGPIPLSLPRRLDGPAIQFYLKASGTAGIGLYALDQECHDHYLTGTFINVTAARQVWTELQDFYGLEDLHVLGEVAHATLMEHRTKSKI